MNDNHYEDMLTVDELCEMLDIGRNTAYTLLKNGEISGAFRCGRKWKICRGAVIRYIQDKSKLQW